MPLADSPFSLSDLDFDLPDDLIAQQPAPRREDARLMVLNRKFKNLQHATILHLRELLRHHDLLILNDTKVLPAKFLARRQTGGAVPGLFLEEVQTGRWRVLLQNSARLKSAETIAITAADGAPLALTLREQLGPGEWLIDVEPAASAESLLFRFGTTPLPPYIRRAHDAASRDTSDSDRYQTVYARRAGAVAAPTAGLHFTAPLLAALSGRGVRTAFVTLHVGVGTFKPISVERLADHVMHEEWFDVPAATAEAVRQCRTEGGRVVAVGTTSARVLESSARTGSNLIIPQTGRTRIFIYPPYRFAVVDALLTNFHLPRSTLLAMIMAFAGAEFVRSAYREAVANRYRFYSYGDAMFID